MTDMHFMYGHANGNVLNAPRLYADKFINQKIPSPKLLFKILHLCESSLLGTHYRNSGRLRSVLTLNTENCILRIAEENLGTSVKKIYLKLPFLKKR